MKLTISMEQWKLLRQRALSAILLLAALALVTILTTERAGALYILTGVSDSAIVLDKSADQEEVQSFSSHIVYLGTGLRGFEVSLKAKMPVIIHKEGGDITAVAKRESVSSLLTRLGVDISPLDMVLVDLSRGNVVELTIGSDVTYYDREVEYDPHDVVRVETPELPVGTEQVVQKGADGVRTSVYEVVYSNGEQVSRQLVAEENSTAVVEEILVGTGDPNAPKEPLHAIDVSDEDAVVEVVKNEDGSGVLVFASGERLEFSSVKAMTATAYTTGYDGVGTITATGTIVAEGTVAVDKKVIPLGSRVYVVTEDGSIVYGLAVAADTGVRGNIIDLYYNTYRECIQFGRRPVTVYILK